MMEAVVSDAALRAGARVMGYRVSGKNGHRVEGLRGAWLLDQTSTCGVRARRAASNRRLAAVVVIDEPTGGAYYGGEVAAPVFSSGDVGALRLLAVAAPTPAAHCGDHAGAGAGPVVTRGEDGDMSAVLDDAGVREYRMSLAALLDGSPAAARRRADRLALDSRQRHARTAFLACQGRCGTRPRARGSTRSRAAPLRCSGRRRRESRRPPCRRTSSWSRSRLRSLAGELAGPLLRPAFGRAAARVVHGRRTADDQRLTCSRRRRTWSAAAAPYSERSAFGRPGALR